MSDDDFPPNSLASKDIALGKNLDQVTTTNVIRKKRSFGRQLKETFIAGDLKSSARYVTLDILLPTVRDMLWEAVSGGIEKLIFGDSRRRSGPTVPQHGATGYVRYDRISTGPMSNVSHIPSSAARAMSRMGRSRHNFDELILSDRGEAEDVIDRLMEVVSKYGEATVADLYELVGVTPAHTDYKWGWKDLQGSGVTRDRNGFLLDLPNPIPFS